MIRTSWVGIYAARESINPYVSAARGALQRPPDLIDGDDAAQHALAVDGEQRAEVAQGLGGQELLARGARRHRPLAVVGDHQLADRAVALGAAQTDHVLERGPVDDSDEAPGGVDHGKPLPPLVAQEIVLVGAAGLEL